MHYKQYLHIYFSLFKKKKVVTQYVYIFCLLQSWGLDWLELVVMVDTFCSGAARQIVLLSRFTLFDFSISFVFLFWWGGKVVVCICFCLCVYVVRTYICVCVCVLTPVSDSLCFLACVDVEFVSCSRV